MSRNERLAVTMILDKEMTMKYLDLLKVFTDWDVRGKDTVEIKWSFDIDYWGKVVERMEAVLVLINDGVIVRDIDLQELEHGYCLAGDFFVKYNTLRNLLKEKGRSE